MKLKTKELLHFQYCSNFTEIKRAVGWCTKNKCCKPVHLMTCVVKTKVVIYGGQVLLRLAGR